MGNDPPRATTGRRRWTMGHGLRDVLLQPPNCASRRGSPERFRRSSGQPLRPGRERGDRSSERQRATREAGGGNDRLHPGLAPRAYPSFRPGRRHLACALRRRQLGSTVRSEPDRGRGRLPEGNGGEDGYSGFWIRDVGTGETRSTGLGDALSQAGVGLVALCGLATDYCVKETALDAIRLGYQVVVLTDAIRAVDLHPGDGERALQAMRRAGVRCI